MVRALQHNTINDFKTAYRTLDALLIDDIQFFAGKERSQEEFFHTFNALLEGQQQVILTCDRYPKEVEGLEERLKSRFGWGLTVAIEPPELETCVAILMSKASAANVELPEEVSVFRRQAHSLHVRELEGALRRVIANSQFTGRPITLDLREGSAERTCSRCRSGWSRSRTSRDGRGILQDPRGGPVVEASQPFDHAATPGGDAFVEGTHDHSLPEIGDAFGGRDHTTVLQCLPRDQGIA